MFHAAAFLKYPLPFGHRSRVLRFKVFLSRMLPVTVRVDYATSDGTAQAGQDYEATSGTLTFAPRETAKIIDVRVLKDSHDEGDERMTMTLSNPRPSSRLRLQDATAPGKIINSDPDAEGVDRALRSHGGGSGAGCGGPPDAGEAGTRRRGAHRRAADRPRPGVRSRPARISDVQRGRCVRPWAADERARSAAGLVLLADCGDRRRGASSRSGAAVRRRASRAGRLAARKRGAM